MRNTTALAGWAALAVLATAQAARFNLTTEFRLKGAAYGAAAYAGSGAVVAGIAGGKRASLLNAASEIRQGQWSSAAIRRHPIAHLSGHVYRLHQVTSAAGTYASDTLPLQPTHRRASP